MSRPSTRILITGHPQAGKSTLADLIAKATGFPIMATDALAATHEWSEASAAVAEWFTTPGPWIIEGVTVSRALRKYHKWHPKRVVPCDILITLRRPADGLRPGQVTMCHAQDTYMAQIKPWLDKHVKCKTVGQYPHQHIKCAKRPKAAKARKKKK